MRHRLCLCLLVCLGWGLFAASAFANATAGQSDPEDAFEPRYKPIMTVPRVDGDIDIDGQFDEAIWQRATRENHFVESSPGDQIKPPVKSAALVAYSSSHLYVGLIAWDNPDEIRASLRERDNIFRDDYFGIMLDTYGDQTWGYEIFVNPLGVQGDLRWVSGNGEDLSFDIVFESEGMVTDSGYQVEIAIPFASLRFPDAEEQNWRVNFWRDRQRDRRNRYTWAAQDRDDPCFMCQWGYMEGIRDIKPSTNLEILPNIVASQSGELRDDDDPTSEFDNADLDAEASFNVRYGLTSNSSLQATANPDFSQVEADQDRIDVNSTFALFFPERRPFFQEGSDQFNTWINQVYTRTINAPQYATKFTGQFGRASVAYLFARDENTPMLIPGAEQSDFVAAEKSWVNIARYRQSFFEDSYVGLLVTDRRLNSFGGNIDDQAVSYNDGSGSTYGVDARVRFSRNWHVEFQTTGSYTVEPDLETDVADSLLSQETFDYGRHTTRLDGEEFGGVASYLSFERGGRTWNFDIDYWEYSPTFRTANGFTTKNDYRQVSLWSSVLFRPNGHWVVEWEPSLNIGRVWDHGRHVDLNPFTFKGGSKDEWIRPAIWMNLRGQTSLYIQYLNSRERFGGKLFEGISILTINPNFRPSEFFSGGFNANFGRGIFRDLDNPELANQENYSVWITLKPTSKFEWSTQWSYSRMKHRDRYLEQNPDEDPTIFEGYVLYNRFNYQFSREWDLRLVVQYNQFSERLAVDPLVTWRLNPFTIFYVGVTSRYQYYREDNVTAIETNEWELSHRQVFAKLQYLFRL